MPYFNVYDVFSNYSASSEFFTVRELFIFAGYGASHVGDGFLDVTRRTVSRWRKGEVPLPSAVFRALQYRAGDLSEILGGKWRRWRVAGDCLYDPDDNEYTQTRIRQIPAMQYRIVQLQRELEELRARLAPPPRIDELPKNVLPLKPPPQDKCR